MAKFIINGLYNSQSHKQEVEAQKYVHEGEYFVFYANGGQRKILTIAASLVKSIDYGEEIDTPAK